MKNKFNTYLTAHGYKSYINEYKKEVYYIWHTSRTGKGHPTAFNEMEGEKLLYYFDGDIPFERIRDSSSLYNRAIRKLNYAKRNLIEL